MSCVSPAAHDLEIPVRTRIGKLDVVLLSCSLFSLITSCVLWSANKQVWMDEIFTWKEVSDRSLWHLYYAIQHGADGGQPVFYTTAWLWAKVFGAGVLTLRLYSSVAMCAALLVTWITMRRFYGVWATAFGVLTMWGRAGLLLDQNVEARFYGLYMFVVAVTCYLWVRLIEEPRPSRLVLLATFSSQAVLVLTHVMGVIFSGLILLALMLIDVAKNRFRLRLYIIYAAGWLALLIWFPAIHASMAAGKPHGWIAMPTIANLRGAYLFEDFSPWLRLIQVHSLWLGFHFFKRLTQIVNYVSLVAVAWLVLRKIVQAGWRTIADSRDSFLVLAYFLLLAPVLLFLLSFAVTPVFVARYFLPSGIGMAIILAAAADALGADQPAPSRRVPRSAWLVVIALSLVWPVLTAAAVAPVQSNYAYLDVPRLEKEVPDGGIVVMGWEQDFVKLMRLSSHPGVHYVYLLDWPSALVGPRGFVVDYHLMQAYRNSGYYANNIQDSANFFCTHTDFLVLDAPNAIKPEGQGDDFFERSKPDMFDIAIRPFKQFQWKVIDNFGSAEITRNLVAVHRVGTLPFCQ